MTPLQLAILGLVALSTGIAVLFVRAETSARTAVTSVLVLATLVPADISTFNRAFVLLGAGLLLLVGSFRSRVPIRPRPVYALAMLIFVTVRTLYPTASTDRLLSEVGMLAVLAFLLLVTANMATPAFDAIKHAAAIIILSQTVFAVQEAVGREAPWPRRDGVTFLIEGTNNLLLELGMRAMGSTGFAITLGILVAVAGLAALWAFMEHRQLRWLVLTILAIVIIALSGTRTAALAFLLGVVVMVLARWGGNAVYAGLVALPFVLVTNPLDEIARSLGIGEDFTQSRSFVHRSGLLENAGRLLERDGFEVLLGVGPDRAKDYITSGLLGGVADVGTYDNDYLRYLAAFGLVGLILLGLTLVLTFIVGPPELKVLIVALVVGASSYDVTGWFVLTALIIVIAGGAVQSITRQTLSEEGTSEREDEEPENLPPEGRG